MKKILTFFLLSLLISCCDKYCCNNKVGVQPQLVDNDFLIFGHFYGECSGPQCVKIFKLTKDKLYEETNYPYSGIGSSKNYIFKELPNDKFNVAKDLMSYFPNQLRSVTEKQIGCPDCRDQGGIYVELSENGAVKTWEIDNDKDAVPDYLPVFVSKVHEKIGLILN